MSEEKQRVWYVYCLLLAGRYGTLGLGPVGLPCLLAHKTLNSENSASSRRLLLVFFFIFAKKTKVSLKIKAKVFLVHLKTNQRHRSPSPPLFLPKKG